MIRKSIIWFVSVLALIPIYWLLSKGANASWQEIESELLTTKTMSLVGRTLLFASTVTLCSILISLPLSWLVMRTNLKGKTWWAVIFALPLGVPSYVMATSYVLTFAKGGWLGNVMESFGGDPYSWAYGFWPAVCVLTLVTYPYVFLSLCMGFKGVPDSLRQASRSLGVSPFQTFIKVEWPILVPSVVSGGLLIFLYALSDFGAVATLKCETFTWVIYQQIESSWTDTVPALHSSLLVLLTVSVLMLQWRFKKAQLTESSVQSEIVGLGPWQMGAQISCGFVLLVGLVMPLWILISWSFDAVDFSIQLSSVSSETIKSVLVALLSTGVVVLLSLPLAIAASSAKKIWEPLIYIGFALPGIVIGLAYVKFFSRLTPDFYFNFGLIVLILAYVVRYLPEAFGILKARRLHMNANLEVASSSLGLNHWQTFLKVTLPLMVPGMAIGGILVFLTVLKELPITLILAPRDFSTLAMKVWMHVEEAEFAEAAMPALMIMLLSALPLLYISLKHRKVQLS